MAGELLRVLAGQVTHQWHDIVAFEESLVYQYTEHEVMWISPGAIVSDRERQTIHAHRRVEGERMSRSEVAPKGNQIQRTILYVNSILIGVSDWRRGAGETRPKKLWFHTDNDPPRTAKTSINFLAFNEMKKAPSTHFTRLGPLGLFSAM
jgi:hypothetical protein